MVGHVAGQNALGTWDEGKYFSCSFHLILDHLMFWKRGHYMKV